MAVKTGAIVKWHGGAYVTAMKTELRKGLRLATAYARKRIVRRISKSNHGKRTKWSTKKGARSPPVTVPSKPGEPPRAGTGKLRQSIFGSVHPGAMYGVVGTTLKYGAALERGANIPARTPKRRKALRFPGTGVWVFARYAKGFKLKKRPYIYSTVKKNRNKIMYLISKPAREKFTKGVQA